VSTQVGRLEFEDRPEVYQHATGEVSVTGAVFCDTVGKADFLRRQVVAMAEPKAEEVIPLVVEDGFSGYVRVTKATAEAVDGSMGQGHWFRYSITAEPVLGSGLPVVESIVTGAVRQNAHTITSSDALPFHAVPGSRTTHSWAPTGVFIGSEETRTVEGGTVLWRCSREFGDPPTYSGVATWAVEAEDWYEGACGVETLVDGEYLSSVAPGSLDDTWRAGNGLVRFWVTAGSDELSFQWFNSSWSSTVAFNVLDAPGGAVTWRAARLIRSQPEMTSVLLVGDYVATSDTNNVFATLTIRRGSPWVDIKATINNTGLGAFELHAASPVAATDATSHIYQTTAVSSWRWIAATDLAFTADTTNGAIEQDGSNLLTSFGVGAAHTSWTDSLALADSHLQWFAVQGERTVVGNRL
jgi:hypothetical protein